MKAIDEITTNSDWFDKLPDGNFERTLASSFGQVEITDGAHYLAPLIAREILATEIIPAAMGTADREVIEGEADRFARQNDLVLNQDHLQLLKTLIRLDENRTAKGVVQQKVQNLAAHPRIDTRKKELLRQVPQQLGNFRTNFLKGDFTQLRKAIARNARDYRDERETAIRQKAADLENGYGPVTALRFLEALRDDVLAPAASLAADQIAATDKNRLAAFQSFGKACAEMAEAVSTRLPNFFRMDSIVEARGRAMSALSSDLLAELAKVTWEEVEKIYLGNGGHAGLKGTVDAMIAEFHAKEAFWNRLSRDIGSSAEGDPQERCQRLIDEVRVLSSHVEVVIPPSVAELREVMDAVLLRRADLARVLIRTSLTGTESDEDQIRHAIDRLRSESASRLRVLVAEELDRVLVPIAERLMNSATKDQLPNLIDRAGYQLTFQPDKLLHQEVNLRDRSVLLIGLHGHDAKNPGALERHLLSTIGRSRGITAGTFVAIDDPHRVLIYAEVCGVPLYALSDIDNYRVRHGVARRTQMSLSSVKEAGKLPEIEAPASRPSEACRELFLQGVFLRLIVRSNNTDNYRFAYGGELISLGNRQSAPTEIKSRPEIIRDLRTQIGDKLKATDRKTIDRFAKFLQEDDTLTDHQRDGFARNLRTLWDQACNVA